MAWCHQAPSHYLSQCWPSSMSPNGVTRPQWVSNQSMVSVSCAYLCRGPCWSCLAWPWRTEATAWWLLQTVCHPVHGTNSWRPGLAGPSSETSREWGEITPDKSLTLQVSMVRTDALGTRLSATTMVTPLGLVSQESYHARCISHYSQVQVFT